METKMKRMIERCHLFEVQFYKRVKTIISFRGRRFINTSGVWERE